MQSTYWTIRGLFLLYSEAVLGYCISWLTECPIYIYFFLLFKWSDSQTSLDLVIYNLFSRPCYRSWLHIPRRYFKSHPRYSICSSHLLSTLSFKSLLPQPLTRPCVCFALDCQFELSGADGIVRSSQVEQEEKTKPGQAVDCIWTIKATPNAKVRPSSCWVRNRLSAH